MNDVMKMLRTARRFALPVSLGLLNIALAGLWFLILTPELADVDLEWRKVRANNINLRNMVETSTVALETIDENRVKFSGLRQRGFMDSQNRLGVTKLLDRLREIHGLTSIYYEIAPETIYDDPATRRTGFNVISTKVVVKMRGLFDADLLEFAQAIIDEFPGQVRPLTFSLLKLTSPTETALSSLRAGKPVDFVGGELTFEWNTLRPIVKKTNG